jgi:hypothetical protein
MSDLIFNRSTDNYVFTGSRLRGGTNNINPRLRLSSANNESIIDLCNNGNVDISASSVFINGLKVVTSSNGDATTLTALQLAQNLDVSGIINSDGGIQIGSGVYGGTITKSSNMYEIIIDPFGIDGSNSSTQDASGTVVIMGDLVVRGNTTTIYSTNVDISDVLLTLASGSTTELKSDNAGIQLGDGYASLLYDSALDVWKTNIGLNISGGLTVDNGGIDYSGNVLALNNSSKLPVTANTFTVLNELTGYNVVTQDLLYGDVSANIWMDASGYINAVQVLSNNSLMKIEVKVAYTASPEADQTLGFRVLRAVDGTGDSYSETPVFSDISFGTSMGVTLNGIYYGSFYDYLAPLTLTNNVVYYKLQFRRDCPQDDTISTPFGIRGATSNYFAIQELYRPAP